MAASRKKGLSFALVGSETLRGREIKRVLNVKRFPLRAFEFYDPDVEEEFSKLTQFGEEPKVVHHLDRKVLEGLDLVLLAADARTNSEIGEAAAGGITGPSTWPRRSTPARTFPSSWPGSTTRRSAARLSPVIANPNPATIILSRLLHALDRPFGVAKALAVVLEPVSAFEEEGIQELAEQSFALLGSSALPKKVFREQVAFNLLPATEKPDPAGFSARETRIASECRRVLAPADFPLSVSLVLAPVFHTYSVMLYVELRAEPISSSILGVGSSKRLSAVRWGVAGNIVMAWVLTIPTCGLAAAVLYGLIRLCGIH